MTKDEAIKIIQTEMECVKRPDCDRLACAYCDLAMREEDVLTAYQMALTALQTDGDCISRRAILDMLGADDAVSASDIDKLSDVGVAILTARLAMIKAVLALSSVQPEERTEERTETHACDCISRQAAIDALDVGMEFFRRVLDDADIVGAEREKFKWGLGLIESCISDMKELPSAQPERTCVNCGRTVNNGGWYADGGTRCPIEEHYALPKDGYCHLWEKRNVTDDDYPERRTDE